MCVAWVRRSLDIAELLQGGDGLGGGLLGHRHAAPELRGGGGSDRRPRAERTVTTGRTPGRPRRSSSTMTSSTIEWKPLSSNSAKFAPADTAILVHGVVRTAVPELHLAAARRGFARTHPGDLWRVAQPVAGELDRAHRRRARLAEPTGLGRSRRAVVAVAHQRHRAALARAGHHMLRVRPRPIMSPSDHSRPAHRTPRPRRSPRQALPHARARHRRQPRTRWNLPRQVPRRAPAQPGPGQTKAGRTGALRPSSSQPN